MNRNTQSSLLTDTERLEKCKNPSIYKIFSKILKDDSIEDYPYQFKIEVILERDELPKRIVTVNLQQLYQIREKDADSLIKKYMQSQSFEKYLSKEDQKKFNMAHYKVFRGYDSYGSNYKRRSNTNKDQNPTQKFSRESSLENSFEKFNQGGIDRGINEEIKRASKTSQEFQNSAKKFPYDDQKFADQQTDFMNQRKRSNQQSEQKVKDKNYFSDEYDSDNTLQEAQRIFQGAVQFKKNEGLIIHDIKGAAKNELLVFSNYEYVPQLNKTQEKIFQKTQQQSEIEHLMAACNNAMGTEVYHDLDFFTIMLSLSLQMNNSEMVNKIEQSHSIDLRQIEGLFFDGPDLDPYYLRMLHGYEKEICDKHRWQTFDKIVATIRTKFGDVGKVFLVETLGSIFINSRSNRQRFQHFFVLKENALGQFKPYQSLKEHQTSFHKNPPSILEEIYTQNNRFIKSVDTVRVYCFYKYQGEAPATVQVQKKLLKEAKNKYTDELDSIIESISDEFNEQIRQRQNDNNQDPYLEDDDIEITEVKENDEEQKQELPQKSSKEEAPLKKVLDKNPVNDDAEAEDDDGNKKNDDENDDNQNKAIQNQHQQQMLDQLRNLINDNEKPIQQSVQDYLVILRQNFQHQLDQEDKDLKVIDNQISQETQQQKVYKEKNEQIFKQLSSQKNLSQQEFTKNRFYKELEVIGVNLAQSEARVKTLQRLSMDKQKVIKQLKSQIHEIEKFSINTTKRQSSLDNQKNLQRNQSFSQSQNALKHNNLSSTSNEKQQQTGSNFKDNSQQKQQYPSLERPPQFPQSQQQKKQPEYNRQQPHPNPQYPQKKDVQQSQITGEIKDQEKRRDIKSTYKSNNKDEKINSTLQQNQRQNDSALQQIQRQNDFASQNDSFGSFQGFQNFQNSPFKMSTENTDNSRQTIVSQQSQNDKTLPQANKRSFGSTGINAFSKGQSAKKRLMTDPLSDIPSMFEQEENEEDEEEEEEEEEEKKDVHANKFDRLANKYGEVDEYEGENNFNCQARTYQNARQGTQLNRGRNDQWKNEEDDLNLEDDSNENQRENIASNPQHQNLVIVDEVEVKKSASQEKIDSQEAEQSNLQCEQKNKGDSQPQANSNQTQLQQSHYPPQQDGNSKRKQNK